MAGPSDTFKLRQKLSVQSQNILPSKPQINMNKARKHANGSSELASTPVANVEHVSDPLLTHSDKMFDHEIKKTEPSLLSEVSQINASMEKVSLQSPSCQCAKVQRPCGLVKLDNNGFVNSTLQCLGHIIPFRKYFTGGYFNNF